MKLDELRSKFLGYFRAHGHTVVKSSSLVPEKDPTLLFSNAGMNQFKDVFLGLEKREYTRACSSQKCFRASGKHNDLENVGFTARHHTFFEMLGNFSFGDYFKKEAIAFAWEFITKELGLDRSRLWITIFREDEQAFDIWRKDIGISPERIVRMGESDNFWSMGETGPCGPCSEIIFDQGEKVGCGKPDCKVGCDCDRYLELWNLVFMQFNRDENGKLTPLPKPCVDTGMGLERITAVMQGKLSNYDTDHFQSIIARISELSGKKYHQDEHLDNSMRVIADHSRAMTFLISDGILPSNEGRGYVLRRVMRRALRHARLLGFEKPILFKLCERVIELMREPYPELVDRRDYIEEVIRNEEERFLQTLDNGLRLIREEIEKHKKEQTPWTLPGEIAFKLYDTYGFPLDLTQVIGRDEGFVVDLQGFEREMEKQKERARASWKGSGDEDTETLYKQIRQQGIKSEFSGYDKTQEQGRVIALIEKDVAKEKISGAGKEFQLISDRTCFYGETGGQVGDRGWIKGENFEAEVIDTTRPMENLIVHHCKLTKGEVKLFDLVEMKVDSERRWDTARNHSATHLLQSALRKILGTHVQQKGSLVSPDRLRFDFTHFSPLSEEEIKKVESLVNRMIRENAEVKIEYLSYPEALDRGAIALFGEKYGEVVRLITMGDFSKELCGGTHCSRTGDIGLFKIVSEASVAAGVRRIEALSGRGAVEYIQSIEKLLNDSAGLLKAIPEELPDRIKRLQEENKKLKQELKHKQMEQDAPDVIVKNVDGVPVVLVEMGITEQEYVLNYSDKILQKHKTGVFVFGSKDQEKAYLLVRVSKDLSKKFDAGKLVSRLSEIVGGKGGGRAELARGAGSKPEKLKEALEAVPGLVQERSSKG